MSSIRRALMLLCALVIIALPVTAQEQESSLPLDNIQVTIRYDTVEIDGTRMVKTREVVAQEGSLAKLLTGSRVPIAMSEMTGDGADSGGPATMYTYQNIGFSAEIRAWILPDGRISLEAKIESSRISPESDDQDHPLILTYQQHVQVVLTDGKPMQVTRVEDPERVTGYFELTAKILE